MALAALLRFVRDLSAWRHAKHCAAYRHDWERVKHPERRFVTITRCRYCGAAFHTDKREPRHDL